MTFSSDQSLNTNQLPISFDVNPEEKEYDNILNLYIRRIASAVNTKESGLYLKQENANFEQWFGNTQNVTVPYQTRSAYRTTVDFVALSGGNIPVGTSGPYTLTPTTQPPAIVGYLYPVQGFGGALDINGISYFPSDPFVTITFNGTTNEFTVINNTGAALTWLVFVIEYIKN